MVNNRQIIILAAFCLPLFLLVFRFYTEVGQEKITQIPAAPPIPRGKPVTATAVAEEEPEPAVEPPPTSLTEERRRIKRQLGEAIKMTQEQYQEKRKNDPTLIAPTIEVRRERLAKRMGELNKLLYGKDDDDATAPAAKH